MGHLLGVLLPVAYGWVLLWLLSPVALEGLGEALAGALLTMACTALLLSGIVAAIAWWGIRILRRPTAGSGPARTPATSPA